MRKLLVVIDYQNDFVDGTLGFEKAKMLESGIHSKVTEYLEAGNQVLFTYDTHFQSYLETREGKNLPVMHCVENSVGHNLYGTINEFSGFENTIHIKKEGFGISPKTMLELEQVLEAEVEHIELVGVVTNICVVSNAILFQSQFRNAEVVVDASLCASFDNELHEKALDVMAGLQVKIINRGNA